MVNDKSEKDHEDRIKNLKSKIKEITGADFISGSSKECPAALEEKFLESVLAFEEGEPSQLFETLVTGGMSLPAPNKLNDMQLTKKLWEIIQALSLLGVFLYHTDHLSDRELYEILWKDTLREEDFLEPTNPNSACHIDIIGRCSEEDILIYLKYYADEMERIEWANEFSKKNFPAHEKKPYDRDRHLPKREEWVEGRC